MKKNEEEKINEESTDYEFIREKIKKRPVNKKKVVKKMLITAGSAVLFSLIACITFIFLEPILAKMIDKKGDGDTNINKVVLSEVNDDDENADDIDVDIDETPYEETPIENLNLEDDLEKTVSENSISQNSPVYVKEKKQLELEDYRTLGRKMYSLSTQVRKCMVVVHSISSDTDILNDRYLSTNSSMGLVIADTSGVIYILVDGENIENAEEINISFASGDLCPCTLKRYDANTGLAVVTIRKKDIPDEVRDKYEVATFGSSNSRTLIGSPVIAVGDPIAVGDSVCYGFVTSTSMKMEYVDSTYQVITTDICGSVDGTGIIVNTRGQVVAFISKKCMERSGNITISGYGITGIKDLIENLSNGENAAYIGLHITDASLDIKMAYKIPGNVYVTKVESGSPASTSGLMAGDVVTSINGELVMSTEDYMERIKTISNQKEIKIGIKRQTDGVYKDMSITLITGDKYSE